MIRLLVAVVLLTCPIGVAPRGDESRLRWLVESGGATGQASLSYAEPESDLGLIVIACELNAGHVDVVPSVPAKRIKAGEKGTIRLSRSNVKLTLQGEAFYSELDEGTELSARLPNADDLLPLFRNDGTLLIEVPGNLARAGIDQKAREALAEFLKHCRPRNE